MARLAAEFFFQEKASFSKYPLGSFREMLSLILPIILTLFSGSLMSFFDRLFIAQNSITSLEACVNGAFLSYLFQICLMFLTNSAQVFIGRYYGASQYEQMGVYVWQMIWISIFSMAITLPLSYVIGDLFFRGTSIEQEGRIYFNCLMLFNFFYPLGAALSAFFIGQGKTRYIFFITLLVNVLNIILDSIFIFGLPGFFPRLGILGAALATGISQGIFCILLMFNFLQSHYRKNYGTGRYQIQKTALWECLKMGFPRSITRLVVVGIWVLNIYLLTTQGEDFLLVFSLGSSMSLLFLFINDGMLQGIQTIASYMLGRNEDTKLYLLMRSGLLFLGFTSIFVAIPCLICPRLMLNLFIQKETALEKIELLVTSCRWIWVFFVAHGLSCLFFSFLSAYGDMFFTMLYNIFFSWLFQYIPMLIALKWWNLPADRCYLVLAFGSFCSAVIYFVRFLYKKRKLSYRNAC